MKRGAVFVNASHSDVLDRAGLLSALESGDIAGAGIAYRDPELERLDNVVAAPFLPFPAGEVAERVADLVLENVRRFLAGEPPRSPLGAALGWDFGSGSRICYGTLKINAKKCHLNAMPPAVFSRRKWIVRGLGSEAGNAAA